MEIGKISLQDHKYRFAHLHCLGHEMTYIRGRHALCNWRATIGSELWQTCWNRWIEWFGKPTSSKKIYIIGYVENMFFIVNWQQLKEKFQQNRCNLRIRVFSSLLKWLLKHWKNGWPTTSFLTHWRSIKYFQVRRIKKLNGLHVALGRSFPMRDLHQLSWIKNCWYRRFSESSTERDSNKCIKLFLSNAPKKKNIAYRIPFLRHPQYSWSTIVRTKSSFY